MAPAVRLRELALLLGRESEGDPETELDGVASLDEAGPRDLAFVRTERHRDAALASKAGALILAPGLDVGVRAVLRSPHPVLDFARACEHLVPQPRPDAGIHPAASVSPRARVHPTASVEAGAVVSEGCEVGARSVIGPNVTLYRDVAVGDESWIHAGCVLREATRLGRRVVLQPGVVLGGDGFGYTFGPDGRREKVPQLGRVVVEDDVEIGANATIDRATLGTTRIGRGTKIDNLVMVAHNCDVGSDVVIVSQSGLAGSTRIGDRSILMAQSGTAGHLEIGADVFVAGRSGVTKDVAAASRVGGFPHVDHARFRRITAAISRLPELVRRLRRIERQLGVARTGGDDPA